MDTVQGGAEWETAEGTIHPGACAGLEGSKEGELEAEKIDKTGNLHDKSEPFDEL
jgi:hypothetical protein